MVLISTMEKPMFLNKLPKALNTKEDLDKVLEVFYSQEFQTTDYKYLRFGQFIYNQYNLETPTSYNQKDVTKAYTEILNLL